MLNSVSRNRSEVGRTPSHAGALSRRPFSVPAIMRISQSWHSTLVAFTLVAFHSCDFRRSAEGSIETTPDLPPEGGSHESPSYCVLKAEATNLRRIAC